MGRACGQAGGLRPSGRRQRSRVTIRSPFPTITYGLKAVVASEEVEDLTAKALETSLQSKVSAVASLRKLLR